MILNTGFNGSNKGFNNNISNNFNKIKTNNYVSTIKNLEKAQDILDQRLKSKQISNEDYIKKSNEIKNNIEKYKNNN